MAKTIAIATTACTGKPKFSWHSGSITRAQRILQQDQLRIKINKFIVGQTATAHLFLPASA